MRNVWTAVLLATTAAAASAQSNTIDGLDAYLLKVSNPRALGRVGTFPTGVNGLGLSTTICNTGTVGITWQAAMDPDHPLIALLVARDYQGHFEQISSRSWLKHNFAAGNQSDCAVCTSSDSTVLAPDCADTYTASESGDRYWLGPPSEVDPWLGTWDPTCSYFDQGDPPVAPPDDCDGVRSLTSAQVGKFDAVKNRLQVNDADFNVTGANFYFWGGYLVQGEAESLRDDTGGSRPFTATWSGTKWTLRATSTTLNGTILKQWKGATITSNTNGGDDGRVFVGVLVTGPDSNGTYHYEYALHNRDNGHAISEFHLPICPGASISNPGFHDLDADAANDWTFAQHDAEIVWSNANNPLEWNTIYSFWFDSDTAPATNCRALLTEARSGGGLPAFDVVTTAPTAPIVGVDLGSGKAGSNGVVPDMTVCGGLDVGETANVSVRYAPPQTAAFLVIGDQDSPYPYRGGLLVPFPPLVIDVTTTDDFGEAFFSFDGISDHYDLFAQYVVDDVDASQGIAMTDAVEVVH